MLAEAGIDNRPGVDTRGTKLRTVADQDVFGTRRTVTGRTPPQRWRRPDHGTIRALDLLRVYPHIEAILFQKGLTMSAILRLIKALLPSVPSQHDRDEA